MVQIYPHIFIIVFFQKDQGPKSIYLNKTKPKENKSEVDQAKIDAILDKISQSGYASLTKEEKELLFRAGKS